MTPERKTGVRGPGRTTREDWMHSALETLISKGVDQVKVATLAAQLECARSSFYWYFKNRSDLLAALLEHWADTNTKAILDAAREPAQSINLSLAKLYAGWVSQNTFDTALDFAIRDWARRDASVRHALDQSDNARIKAIAEMFQRHGFAPPEADTRARIVYFTQIGYATVDQRETWETRLSRAREYLFCITGVEPGQSDVDFLITATREILEPKEPNS